MIKSCKIVALVLNILFIHVIHVSGVIDSSTLGRRNIFHRSGLFLVVEFDCSLACVIIFYDFYPEGGWVN